jgi:HEPN domain-containing protein
MTRREVAGFLALAREDLAVAGELLAGHGRAAAFHLQQAAEKLIKAVLTLEGIAFPRSHQLGALAALLPEEHAWRADLMALDHLTSHATALRYPLPGGGLPLDPTKADLAASLRQIAALLDALEPWCRARLPG